MQVNIGDRIKNLRKRDGRKQEDLAKALGVTAQAVSRWESNGCYPDMNMIPAIANYFHVSIDDEADDAKVSFPYLSAKVFDRFLNDLPKTKKNKLMKNPKYALLRG